jgi:hypothetical protein
MLPKRPIAKMNLPKSDISDFGSGQGVSRYGR